MKFLSRFLALLALLLVLAAFAVQRPTWYTKELFGERQPVFFLSSVPPTGLIGPNEHWSGSFLIISQKAGDGYTCNIHQVGNRLGDYDAQGREIDGPIPCYVWKNERGGFDGWIEFRGNQRLFCGGASFENLSSRCRSASESN
jgi:hypothetical protein